MLCPLQQPFQQKDFLWEIAALVAKDYLCLSAFTCWTSGESLQFWYVAQNLKDHLCEIEDGPNTPPSPLVTAVSSCAPSVSGPSHGFRWKSASRGCSFSPRAHQRVSPLGMLDALQASHMVSNNRRTASPQPSQNQKHFLQDLTEFPRCRCL